MMLRTSLAETLVLIFLGLVTIWLCARPGLKRDRLFLLVGGLIMIAVAGLVFWILGPQDGAVKELVVHLIWVPLGGALVGLSVRLTRKRKNRPNARYWANAALLRFLIALIFHLAL
jgi:predicted lipid-binding transport protein (Tim44 family)